MKYTAILLLCAVALANARSRGLYPNGCPKNWEIEQLLPHPNCHKFYQCWHGELVEHTCPEDLYFSIEENQCEWSEEVDCSGRDVNNNHNDSGSDQDDNGNGNTGAGNCDPSEAPAICAAEDSDSVLVAHEKCNKFYICAHGFPVALRCPVNLFFNPKTDQCDHLENADCGDRIVPDGNDNDDNDNSNDDNGSEDNGTGDSGTDDNGNGDSGSDDNGNTGSNNWDPSLASEICAGEESDSVLVAHEKCNKFYICAHGVPIARRCPANLFFNPGTDQCDYLENANCGDRLVPDEDDNGNGENGSDGNGSDDNGSDDNGSDDNGNGDNGNTGSNNWDPSLAPEICAAEDSDSILVAHEKCNKFYICNHGVPVALRCPANLFFNPKTDQCDYLENANCGDRLVPDGDDNGNGDNGSDGNGSDDNGSDDNGSGDNGGEDNGNTGSNNWDPSLAPEICAADDSDSILIAHKKCNKFYICANGVPVALRCPTNLFFNPKTDQCDYLENANCGDRLVPDEDDNGNGENGSDGNESDGNGSDDNGSDDNGSDDNGGEDNGNTGSNNWDPSLAPEICAAEDSDSILVAHEKCNKFYICAHGVPVAVRCPDNLFFNPKTDQCDYLENANCGDRLVPDGDDNSNGDNGSDGNGSDGNGSDDNGSDDNGSDDNGGEDNGNTGSNNWDPSLAPEICAAEDSDSILVAHEKCNKFYICAHGVPVAVRCPANLFFNPKTDQCDYLENANCGGRLVPDGDDNSNGDNGSDGNGSDGNGSDDNGSDDNGSDDNGGEDNGNTGSNNWDPSLAPEICAAEDSDSILVAHEKCNKFYICAHGVPVAVRCPANLFFNPKTDQCDYLENANCGDRLVPDGDDNSNGDNGSDGNGSDDNGSDDNGSDDNGSEDNGNGDNGNTGSNNWDPSLAPEICAAEDSDSILVAHEKCNKFYICAHGVPVAVRCPANLFFNPKTDQCDYLENANCGDRLVPDGDDNSNGDNGSDGNGSDDNGSDDNGSDDNGSEDNGNGDNGNTGSNNWDPSLAPEICAAEDSDSILVAHEKCNKFYICAHGVPVAVRCPANLFFNPKTDQCDYLENANCGDRLVPDEDDNGNGENGSDGNGSDDNGSDDNGGEDNGNTGSNNWDPSLAPEICAAEDSDSILVAHQKCNKFYICANGVPVALRCPANLFFNPKTDQCDYLENANCGDRLVPDGDDNSNDNNGSDGNGSDDNGSNDNGSDENGSDDNGSDDNGNGDNGNTGSNNWDPSLAPEICAADDSDSILVAHEKCNKFYICNHGVPVALRCPANLFFNPKTDQCDYLENANCGDRLVPDGDDNGSDDNGSDGNGSADNGSDDNGSDDNGNGGNGGEDNGNTGSNNWDPSLAPEICAAEDSDSILVAHQKCNKFYICANGVPVALRCPTNLFFNPKTDQCDYLENANCGDRLVPDGDDNGSDDNGSVDNGSDDNGNGDSGSNDNGSDDNGGEDNGNTGSNNWDPSLAPEICAAEDSDSILVAHEKCNKFYKCANGVPVARRCAANLFFNPRTDECDYRENVDCGDRVIPDGENDDNNGGNGGDNDGNGDNGSDNNGSDDNGSDDNGSHDNESDDNGGNDNGNTGSNNWDPSLASEICAADDSDSILIAHEKCNKFYKCANGVPVARLCAANLFFNPRTDECDYRENVDCGDRVIPDGENDDNNSDNGGDNDGNGDNGSHDNGSDDNGSDDNGNDDNGSDDNGNGDNGGDDNAIIGANNWDPSLDPEICAAEDSDSILVAHEHCNKFYKCSNGVHVAFNCAANLFFDPRTDRCDYFKNVDCGYRIVPYADVANLPYQSLNKHLESRKAFRL